MIWCTKSLFHHLQELKSGGCMNRRMRFRLVIQKEYTSKTLTVEILLEGNAVTRTEIYATHHERYSLTQLFDRLNEAEVTYPGTEMKITYELIGRGE